MGPFSQDPGEAVWPARETTAVSTTSSATVTAMEAPIALVGAITGVWGAQLAEGIGGMEDWPGSFHRVVEN